ncbi:MAG: hypothetical protein WKF43_00840 [Acidimicrobiales bacterium]
MPTDAVIATSGRPATLGRRLTRTVWVIDSVGAEGRSDAAPALEQLGYRSISSRTAEGASLERWQRADAASG